VAFFITREGEEGQGILAAQSLVILP
jgi:hypothetical protein